MSAILSKCGKYRYSLKREWNHGEGCALFIMLNPSTADASVDDPTIRRCIGFAKAWGYSALEVVNLYAFRATDPAKMFAEADPVGPENDAHIAAAAARANIIIAAWGNRGRPDRVAEVAAITRVAMYALGVTKTGQPRHPLYMPISTKLLDQWPR